MAIKKDVPSSVKASGEKGKPLISNWDEWFKSCGKISGDVASYEKVIAEYLNAQFSNKPEARQKARDVYESRHDSGFFDKDPLIPKWKKIEGFKGFVIGFFLVLIITLVYFVLKTKAVDSGVIIRCAIFGTLGGLLVGGVVVGLHAMKINGFRSRMRAFEKILKAPIAYIPPRFRNSQSIQAFYDLYCNYNVLTLDQAIPACENYLRENNLIGQYLAIMFDEPYENTTLKQVNNSMDDNNRGYHISGGANGDKPLDPNLPDDIQSKVYEGVDNAEERLESLVGLQNVKQQIRQMKNRISFYGDSGAERVSGNNMVFLGPPGTGKTTIARIITRILYDFGYIKENKCVEIDGAYLKSPYVGQTAERASAIIRFALGGVLFIDEAYALMDDKSGAGTEAISVLLKAMEDNKNDLVVIFAGYEDNVNRLLASNEGFNSRIKHKLYFDDFTVEEMMAIFKQLMCSGNNKYKMSNECFDLIAKQFDRERKVPGFGNARVVRNTWDSILDVHADRFMKGEIKADQKFVITKQDVEQYIDVRREQMQADGRNFIAAHNLDSTVVSLQELKGKTKPGSVNPDKDLERLTGLDVVKNEIKQMKAQFEFYDGNMESEGYHMLFLGPPGTGKTTVASIMTGYLYEMGIIQTNSYLDINGDFLRGMYLGHTGKRTEAVVQYAQGMVLFVDEAYLLSSMNGGSDNFGQEAVGVLLDAMEKYRKNFVVIFAGYEYEMNKFLDMNSGLRSRISLEFHFESYSPKELAQMMKNIAKDKGFRVDKNVWLPVQAYFRDQRQNPKFGNGRFVRQFFEECKKSHIMNFSKGKYGDEKKYVITLEDVQPLIGSDAMSYVQNVSSGDNLYFQSGGNNENYY